MDGNLLPEAASNSNSTLKSRRLAIVSAGLLLLALAMVVIYTNRSAFLSPLALVVVAAIGLALTIQGGGFVSLDRLLAGRSAQAINALAKKVRRQE